MARKGGWRRDGVEADASATSTRAASRITDAAKLARIEALVIPPAWKDVWISPHARAKLQATGVDAAGRRQYLYHPEFRARQEQAKYDKLVRFAERLPDLRLAMGEHMDARPVRPRARQRGRGAADQLAWFRVGIRALRGEIAHVRHHDARQESRLRARQQDHVPLSRQAQGAGADDARRRRARRRDQGPARARRAAAAVPLRVGRRALQAHRRGAERLHPASTWARSSRAKDFRTWGGTLPAAIALAERGPPETEAEAEAGGRRRDAHGRRAARQYARGRALLVRQPRGRRAVPGRANDRGFSSAPFARRQARAISASIRRSRRSSACCARGESARARGGMNYVVDLRVSLRALCSTSP